MKLSFASFRVRTALIGTVLAAAYFGVGKASLTLASLHPSASPVWPPTGLAIAALLLLGARYWPAILAGAFLVNVTTDSSVAGAGVIAVGNALEAVAACLLIERFIGQKSKAFETVGGVIAFAFFGAVLAPAISATFGIGGLLLDGTVARDVLPAVWLTWWVGDAVGALTLTPLVVLWCVSVHSSCSHAKALEACFVLLLLVLVAIVVFTPLQQPLAYVCLLPILWTALRFVPRDTALCVALTAVFATAGTLEGWGPFAVTDTNSSLLFLQAFLATCAFTGLSLSAAMLERRLAEQSLEKKVAERTAQLAAAQERDRANAELLRAIMDHMTVATIAVDAQLKVIHMNDHFRTLFGAKEKGGDGTLSDVLSRIRLKFRTPHETVDGLLRVLAKREKRTDMEVALAGGATVFCDYIPIFDGDAHRGHLFLVRDRKELA